MIKMGMRNHDCLQRLDIQSLDRGRKLALGTIQRHAGIDKYAFAICCNLDA